MRQKLFLLALPLCFFALPLAHADFSEQEAVTALTENGASEVLIYETFYSDSQDEATLAQEVVDRMQWDDEKLTDIFIIEEKGDSFFETTDEWFVEAGTTDTSTEVDVELYFTVDSTDEAEILAATREELDKVTLENISEHLVVYEKRPDQSTVYGSIIISDFFGSNNDVFDDVDSSNDYYDAIAYVYDYGIVQGYDNGTYRPENSINRAEFTKILLEAKYPDEMAMATGDDCFTDVAADQWYAKYVCYAKTNAIVDGYSDGSFKPAESINIAEALKITLNVFFSDIPDTGGEWYQKYWDYAESQGLLLDEWGSAGEELSRGAMAEVIYRVLN